LNDRVRTWTYAAQADGKVFTLPGGDLKAVIGAERREEYVGFPGNVVGGQVWPRMPQRNVDSFFAETRIPVVSAKQKLPLLRQLDFNAALRTENYSDFGRSTTPRYGAGWRPFQALLVRGSYGEGFMAPPLYRTYQQAATVTLPASTIATVFPGQVDLSRGNAPIIGPLDQLSGGNPNLKPQLSENVTYGAVLDVPKVKGLALSFDYYDYKFTRAFGSISSMMDRQLFAPESIFRGAKLASDPAAWLGPIIGYDGRTINISRSRSAGYSAGLRYQRTTGWGDFSFSSTGEKTLVREERILPNSLPTRTVNKRYVPMRFTTSLAWNRGPWEAGAAHIYGGRSWTDSNNVAIYPSRYTDDDTKLRVTIINLLDEEPPLNVNGAFSSSVIDPRLRRYIIDLTKRF
jgi:outer membrane receptor protein involved in Fe transport